MGTVVDDFGGTKVADPYRWMESLDSPEVKAWITAQNAVTDPYLNTLPHRKALNERLTALWNYPRVGLPSLEGGQMFYAKNSGLQRQAPIFRRDGIDKPPTLVIDPNVISEEGTLALAEYKVSPDAKLMAYGLSEGGADWETIHVRDLATGKDLADEVRWMRFSAHLVDEGREGLLLLALSGTAEGQGARSRALGTHALLPPRRDAAVRRICSSTNARICPAGSSAAA